MDETRSSPSLISCDQLVGSTQKRRDLRPTRYLQTTSIASRA